MRGADDRKRAQEAKFAQDEQEKFVRSARIARDLGLWAAGHLGMKDSYAEEFADEVRGKAVIEGPEAMIAYVAARLDQQVGEDAVRDKLRELSAA